MRLFLFIKYLPPITLMWIFPFFRSKYAYHVDCLFADDSGETAFVEQPLEDVFRLLHPSLRPVPPCTTSHTSMKVYEEHAMVQVSLLRICLSAQYSCLHVFFSYFISNCAEYASSVCKLLSNEVTYGLIN